MDFKSGKLWAAIVGVCLALVGALTGSDIKKAVCGEPSVMAQPK